jgi:hypothetical protein
MRLMSGRQITWIRKAYLGYRSVEYSDFVAGRLCVLVYEFEGADYSDTDTLCWRIGVSYLSNTRSTLNSVFLCKRLLIW